MIRSNTYTLLILALLIAVLSACNTSGPDPSDFDRDALLSNIGNNLILPAFEDFQMKAEAFDSKVQEFSADPTEANLLDAQNSWKSLAESWVYVSPYSYFGPADDNGFSTSVNIFPTDTVQIQGNIASGTWDLSTAANIDAKGLPALDYLLFGMGEDNTAIASYFAGSADGRSYLESLSAELKSIATNANTAWKAGDGNYINTFLVSNGSDAGGSMSLMTNSVIRDFEILKNGRLGIPLGKKSAGIPLPEKAEGLYSGYSNVLAREHCKAIYDIYLGTSSSGADGQGFYEALESLGTQYDGENLSTVIADQFVQSISLINAIPDPISSQIQSDPSPVDDAYTAVQIQVVLLKSDMSSALGVLITYTDTDGD